MPTTEEILLGPTTATSPTIPASLDPRLPPDAARPTSEDILLPRQGFDLTLYANQQLEEAKRIGSLPLTTLKDEYAAGQDQTLRGLSSLADAKPGGLIDVVLGAARSAGSPITAAARTVADPLSRIVQTVTGIGEETRSAVQSGTELVLQLGFPILAGRTAATTAAKAAAGVGEPGATATAVGATEARAASAPVSLEGVPFTESRVSTELTGKIAQAATDAIAGSLDTSKRLFRNVADALGTGELSPEGLPGLLTKYGVTPQQFAQFYSETVSNSGRTLNQLSQLRKRLETAFADSPAAQDALRQIGAGASAAAEAPVGTYRWVAGLYRKMDDPRRAMLVTQWSTAIRNALSQGVRYTLDSADAALTTVFSGGSAKAAVANGVENFAAVASKMTPAGRAKLQTILNEFPLEAQQLAGTISGEATLTSKFSNFVNPLNVAQEGYFRSIAFDSKLRQLTRAAGLNLDAMAPSAIPGKMISEATRHATEITFAESLGPNSFGHAILQAYRAVPMLTTINAFPRYAGNALKLLWEFNPARLLSPGALRTITTGTPQEAGKVMSRAMLGTAMLGTAVAIRNSPQLGGEKWYELKVPGTDRRLDTRALGPFNLYLLMAEGMVHPDNLSVADWAKGLVGINRVAGTGLVLTDALTSGAIDRKLETFYGFVGQYFGGYSVPFRNLVTGIQIAGSPEASEQARTLRDVRDHPLVDPFLANLPGVSSTLPASPSAFKGETRKEENPSARLFLGVSVRTKNWVEQETDRLGMEFKAIVPSSGIPAWDRAVTEQMGPRVETTVPMLLESGAYQQAVPPIQRILLKAAFSAVRREAVRAAAGDHPDLFVQAKLKGLDPDIRDLLGISFKGMPGNLDLQKALR